MSATLVNDLLAYTKSMEEVMATSVDSAAVSNHSLSADRSEAAKLVAAYFRKPPSYDEFLKL